MYWRRIVQEETEVQKSDFWKSTLKMEREITTLTNAIFANLLDAIPLISNTDDEINPAIFWIYERNAAFFQDIIDDFFIQHPEVSNITEWKRSELRSEEIICISCRENIKSYSYFLNQL